MRNIPPTCKRIIQVRNIVITGSASGLGAQLCNFFIGESDQRVYSWDLPNVDIRFESSIEAASWRLAGEKVDVLINCAGINRIDYIPDTSREDWNDVMDTNARGMFFTVKHLAEKLRGGTIVNIISNASHIPMTASLAYNASKGAAEIMTRQMARELGKTHDITVFGVSPNKLSGTGMSAEIEKRVCELRGWTPEEAKAYQLAALPAGEETDPATLAEFIAFLLSNKQRHKYLAGCIIPYGT